MNIVNFKPTNILKNFKELLDRPKNRKLLLQELDNFKIVIEACIKELLELHKTLLNTNPFFEDIVTDKKFAVLKEKYNKACQLEDLYISKLNVAEESTLLSDEVISKYDKRRFWFYYALMGYKSFIDSVYVEDRINRKIKSKKLETEKIVKDSKNFNK